MALARRSTTSRIDTRERIRAMALTMFNEDGVDRAPLYKVATRLGISPGNLAYHFNKKEDVIRSIVEDLCEKFTDVLSTSEAASPADMAEYQVRLFGLMWDYRFFFGSYPYMVKDNEFIADAYAVISNSAINGTVAQIERAIAVGEMRPVPPPTKIRTLVENIWAVWLHAVGTAPDALAGSERNHAIFAICMRHISMIQPYSSKSFIHDLELQISARLEI